MKPYVYTAFSSSTLEYFLCSIILYIIFLLDDQVLLFEVNC